MIVYIGIHLPTGENHQLEGKREANALAKHPDYQVWEIEGRKGNQFNHKLKAFWDAMLKNEMPPTWAASYYYPPTITRKRSDEHNAKIKEAMTGKAKTEEHKQAISDAMRGNRNRG